MRPNRFEPDGSTMRLRAELAKAIRQVRGLPLPAEARKECASFILKAVANLFPPTKAHPIDHELR